MHAPKMSDLNSAKTRLRSTSQPSRSRYFDNAVRSAERAAAIAQHPLPRQVGARRVVVDLGAVTSAAEHLKSVSSHPEQVLVAAFRSIQRTGPDSFKRLVRSIQQVVSAWNRPAYSPEFHAVLAGLTRRGVPPDLASEAMSLWHLLCTRGAPPEPILELSQDGGMRFAWNTELAYLDVEVCADGSLEWFFKDRVAGITAGTPNERDKELPAEFFQHLARLGNHE